MRKKFTFVASLAFAAALCAGVAGASVTAQADTEWANNFKISATAIRTVSPAGLRFKVDCPVDYSADNSVEAWTKLTFTSDVEGTEKQYSTNVPVTYWRDASGWNTVLLEIPASDYVTEITAQAFVKVNETTTYQTAPVTSSIAKTAAKLMNGGETDTAVTKYVAGAVSNITLNETTAVFEEVGGTLQLTATTTPADFDVVWSSSNEEIATVTADGTVTATGIGSANITASMGGATATCKVSVGDEWCRTNNVSANGVTISNKQKLEFAKGTTSDGDWNRTNTNECEVGYFAFNGSYGVGDFVAFDFTGNNMPIVTLAAKNVNADYYNKPMDTTDTGVVVRNGYTNTQGSLNDNNHNKRIEAYGPYKLQSTGVNPFASQGLSTGVGMLELVDSTDEFRMIVGIEDMTTTQIKVGVVVLNLTQGKQPVFNTITIDITSAGLVDTFEGSIILHGRLGFETTVDKVYPIYENTNKGAVRDAIAALPADLPEWAEKENVTAYNATAKEDRSVVLNKGRTIDGEWWQDQSTGLDLAYMAFNGTYGAGDFVVVDFTGNNMPTVALAANTVTSNPKNYDKANAQIADRTRTGFVVTNGDVNTQGSICTCNHEKRVNVFGPYMMQRFAGCTDQQHKSAGLNQGVGLYELQDSTDKFRMIVGIESITESKVKIGIVIVNLTAQENGDTSKRQPVFNSVEFDVSGIESTFEGSIILYGRLGMETKLDKVYSIYENTTKGDVKWALPGSNF